MVSLVLIHGRASLLDVDCLLHFSLVPILSMDTECPVARQWSPTPPCKCI